MTLARRAVLAFLVALLVGACRGEGDRASPRLPVLEPDLTGMEPAAREQIQASYASLRAKLAASGVPAAELGAAYGETGKLLMAAEHHRSAEACLLNAAALIPGDARWTYYVAHLYKRDGDLVRAASYFARTIATQPDQVAALWWLGAVQLELGRAEDAEASFTKALSLQPNAWQTVYGLGRTALARRDYAKAAEHLERALTMNPQARAVHYQLGLAYRGLGRLPDAEAQLRQQAGVEIMAADPLMTELDALLETSVAYHSRAIQAGKSGAWATALEHLGKAVRLDPRNATVRLDLGIALFRTGSASEAFGQVQEAVRLSPRFARAHAAAGMMMAIRGRDREAIEALTAAIGYDPGFVEAHLGLAQALQRTGQPLEALAHYREVLARVPADSEGQFGSAVALIRLGRYQDARRLLTRGADGHPDEPRFVHALARLLAAAPGDGIRDGRRALSIVEALLKAQPTVDRAETQAMALAELGRFEDAVAWQRHAITELEQGGRADLARQLGGNLALYQRGEPCRAPWRADDPIFFPQPGNLPP